METTNLVTSPFGIGEKLILELLKKGESVHTVFPSPKDVPMSLLGKAHLKYGFVKFDQETNIEKGLPRKAINVFHIYDIYTGPFIRIFTANTTATLLLLDWAKKAEIAKFIYLSTGEVYGQGNNLNETTAYNPRSFYATTKFQAEVLSRYYSKLFDIKTIRPFFPFGKVINQGYIHNLIESIKSGGNIETEYALITPAFIDDIIEPLIRVRELKESGLGGPPYNICGSPMRIEDFIKVVEKNINKSAKNIRIGKTELAGNNSKAKDVLGYKETPIEEALKNTILS